MQKVSITNIGCPPCDTADLARALIQPPASSETPFIWKKYSRQDLFVLARALKAALVEEPPSGRPVCLCTTDRFLTAAALLASLMGAPPMILPSSDAPQTLAEVRDVLPYDLVLSERNRPVPRGVRLIQSTALDPQRASDKPCTPRPIGRPWVYLFTGGSTGRPQVWSKTVANLLGEALDHTRRFHLGPADIVLATVPANHIYGLLYSVLMPLIANARVASQTPTFPQAMLQDLAETRATLLVSIPLHFRALKGYALQNHALRLAFSSAGPLPPPDGAAFTQNSGVPVAEIYGSTETGGIAGRCRAKGEEALKPFEAVHYRIHNQTLWIRSPYLSPELPTDDQGFFKTADRVRKEKNCGFSVLGRMDGIIKIGGRRVDLIDIQESLREARGVTDALVFAQLSQTGREPVICAAIAGDLTEEEVRIHCQTRLAPHQHPKRLRIVPRLPRSTAGKYDRRAVEALFETTTKNEGPGPGLQ